MRNIDPSTTSEFQLPRELARLTLFLRGIPQRHSMSMPASDDFVGVSVRCALTTFEVKAGRDPRNLDSYRIHLHHRFRGSNFARVPKTSWWDLKQSSLGAVQVRMRRISPTPGPERRSVQLPIREPHLLLTLFFVYGRFALAEIHDRLGIAVRYSPSTDDCTRAIIQYIGERVCGAWAIPCDHQHS